MKLVKFTFAFLFSVFAAADVHAIIGVVEQAQLGNPSGAVIDPSNHAHLLVERAQYVMDYNDTTREPNWVSWDLTKADIGASGRSNFIPDTTLPPGFTVVAITDYSGSGYDRGHMCPSADRTVTVADNQVLFYMSNMIPQAPDNNQGVWASFETYCRTLANADNEVLITSGPSGFAGSTIASGVAIPGFAWKIAVVVPVVQGLPPGSLARDRVTSATRVIAIKIPNIAGVRNNPWQQYVTSVAQIEADTGFHFFTALPLATANALRTVVDGQSSAGTPVIVTQPSSQTTVVGGSASFSVTATGDATLTYQWSHEDDEIPGATNATLALNNVQAADVGNYTVVVSNSVGTATSNSASLVVTGLPPSIITPPASQTVNAGSNVTFSVSAGGSPTLTYQWRKGTAAIGGATASTLTLLNVQSADIGSYDVVVTNSVNSATSSAATLAVNPSAPTITGQPVSKTASTGSNTSFTVVATGTAPLSYQWRKTGAPLADGGVISGATTATLLLTGVAAINGGDYDVVVTNVTTATNSVTSNTATLTVNPPPASTVAWDFGAAATPTANPASGLTADITGGTLTVNNNNGASTPFLSTTSATGNGTYTGFSAANNAGAAARVGALVQVGTATTGSAYFEFTLGTSAGKRLLASGLSFGSRSTNTGPAAFAVFTSVDNFAAPVASGTLTVTGNSWALYTPSFTTVTGATGAPITFRLYGYSGAGSPAANTANWRIDDLKLTVTTVFPPPVPPVVVLTVPATAATGVAVTSPITVTFNEAVTFAGSWFTINSALNGPIAASVSGGPTTFALTPPSFFANNDTLTVTILGAQVVDQATGTIHGAGNTTFSFSTEAFVPPTPPMVNAQPSPQSVNVGGSATFTVGATGTAPFNYQWRKNNAAIVGNASATTATLTLIGVTTGDAGNYDCVVSNVAGSDVSHVAALAVTIVPPSITTSPVAQTATVGGSASFSVVVGGTAPFGYQWRKNGTPILGNASATSATLVLSSVTDADSGLYDVIVTNASPSSATSAAATLAVLDAAPSVIYWDFATAAPTSGVPVGVTGGTLTQGNNNGSTTLITAVSPSGSYTGASAGNNAGAAARIGSLVQVGTTTTGSAYFEFTFTAPAGRRFTATAFSFGLRSTGTGPQAFAVYSSLDSFTAPVASGPVSADSVWRLLTPSTGGVTTATGGSVTFRLFGYNGAGNPGSGTANWRIDDLNLTAGLLALPPVAPTIVVPPASQAVALNSPVTFSVTAGGTPPFTYQWYKNNAPLIGSTASTLSIASAQLSDIGNYTVAVSNSVSTVTSTPAATLFVTQGYAAWATARGLTETNNGSSADPEGDGVPNQIEYILGLNPLSLDAAGLPAGTVEAGQFVFRFSHDKTATGAFLVQQTTDLLNWNPLATSVESPSTTTETLIATLPLNAVKQFVRLVADGVATIPVGYMNTTFPSATTVALGLPLDDTSANPIGQRAAKIESFTATTLTNAAGGWTGNLANPAAPWAVRLTSGAAAGKMFDVSANSANTLTLSGATLDTIGVAAGDTFELIPLDTLGTLFGAGTFQAGTSSANADVVQLRSGATWIAFYYDTSLGFWRRTSGAATNSNNTIIRPGSGLLVLRRGPSLTLTFVGRVLGTTFRVAINNASTTGLTTGFPMDTTLGGLGLQSLLSGWRNGTTTSAADSVGLYNGSTWVAYVFNGTNWQTTTGVNSDAVSLPAGGALLIQRPGSTSGTTDLIRTRTY